MTSTYTKFSINELQRLTTSKTLTPVNMILDRTAVDFLLSLNTGNRPISSRAVESIINSITRIGWKSTESLCVTLDQVLGNGQHRLTGLRQMNYPANIKATVIFGVDRDSLLTIDQHNKRSASASLKFAAGKHFSTAFLAAVRHDMLFNPETMSFGSKVIQPSEMADKIDEWMLYEKEMPHLFCRQTVGTKQVALTAPMALAIVHYRQRVGVDMANDFLLGFWGERERPSDSSERRAMDYRVTMLRKRGADAERKAYRIFVRLLLAHYEGRRNPRLTEASDWGILRNRNYS